MTASDDRPMVLCPCGQRVDRSLCPQCGAYNAIYSDRQREALRLLDLATVNELLYGGAKGGGKSYFGCQWVFKRCQEIIRDHHLDEPQQYPPAVGWMGRKRGVDFNDTTLEAWKLAIPSKFFRIRTQDKEIIIQDRVKVDYGGLDSQESVSKFQSAQYGFLFVDQAEETSLDEIGNLRASLNRMRINGTLVTPKALWTANPPLKPSWLRNEFIKAPRRDQRFVRALPTDNPWLPASYLETLRNSYKHRPELLAALLDGKWDLAEGLCEVIRDSWIQSAHHMTLLPARRWRFLVADTARFGDDETVLYGMDETEIVPEFSAIFGHKDSMHIANRLFVMARQMAQHFHQDQVPIWVEEMGPSGPGVVDRLREMGAAVYGVNTAAKASESYRFINLRAEIWWRAGEQFGCGDVSLKHVDHDLDGQLCTPTYDFASGGRIQVQEKEDIKKALGRSPDRADAYVIGLYALRWLRANQPKFSVPLPVVEVGSPAWRMEQRRAEAKRGEDRW